jgi:fructose-1,6-bisphosphatase/inositol monophosphatase family enzyme
VSLQSTAAPETIDDLEEIENMAVELATLAGAEVVTAYGSIFTVLYKTGIANVSSLRDPVSEIDRRLETLIRARLAERFPPTTLSARKSRNVPAVIGNTFGR